MKPRILYITSSKLATMMNNERWHLIQAFKKAGHTIVDIERDELHNYDLIKLVRAKKLDYSLALFEEPIWATKLNFRIHFRNAKKVPIPKATILSDYWTYTKQVRSALKDNAITVLLTNHESSYAYIGRHFGDLLEQILWIPLTIDLDQFKSLPRRKKYDFFLSGTTTHLTPFRNRLIELVKTKMTAYRVFHLEHPGHWKKNEMIGKRGSDYYQLLAQSHFCLVTTGIYNISSRKYWEICAAGSTIFGNWTGLPEHFIVHDNIVQIDDSMSDNKILSILKDAISNKKYWNKQALQAKSLVKNHISTHTIVKRIEAVLALKPQPIVKHDTNAITSAIFGLTKHDRR